MGLLRPVCGLLGFWLLPAVDSGSAPLLPSLLATSFLSSQEAEQPC